MENFLFDAITQLHKAGIKFVICGGIACILQGSNRSTIDLDISIDMAEENLLKMIELAKKMNWRPRVPEPLENIMDAQKREHWIKDKNAKVYTLNSMDGFLQIDIFLTYPINFPILEKNADIFEIEGIQFKVSSVEHLLEAKKDIENKRKQDIYDIEMLEEILIGVKK